MLEQKNYEIGNQSLSELTMTYRLHGSLLWLL